MDSVVRKNEMNDNQRLGSFKVPAHLARSFDSNLKRIMGMCIVVRAEHFFAQDEIEYVALSEYFDVVDPGYKIPEYVWIISDDDGLCVVKR